jgi:hypothetical protein
VDTIEYYHHQIDQIRAWKRTPGYDAAPTAVQVAVDIRLLALMKVVDETGTVKNAG